MGEWDTLASDGEERYMKGVQDLDIEIYGAEVHIQPSKEDDIKLRRMTFRRN